MFTNHLFYIMSTSATAGNYGDDIRSDCLVGITLNTSGGVKINLDSKIKSIYGRQMESLVAEILKFYGIKHVHVNIKDAGALDFVLAARTEAAIQLVHPSKKEFLLPLIPENQVIATKDRFRFTRIYLPGNSPKYMLNAGIHEPDGVILDLEDSVAPSKKLEARFIVRNALRQVDFLGAERMVRINQLPAGLDDLKYIIPHNVHVVLIPKVESKEQVLLVEEKIQSLSLEHDISSPVYLMPILESALGIENAFEIATASENIVAMAIGLEDYTADLGVNRTLGGQESEYARTRLVNACKAAGIQPIDSVFSDVADMEALRRSVMHSRALGFEGIGCIHPRQIEVVKECFNPTGSEIEKARSIVLAFEEAEKTGIGVITLGSKMIDPPVVKRALKTIQLAEKLGLINSDWRNKNV